VYKNWGKAKISCY